MLRDWRDIRCLLTGTPTQQSAYHFLNDFGLLSTLDIFNATLAGTIPIDVDIPGSDLDILCETPTLETLENVLRTNYSQMPDFRCKKESIQGKPSLIALFKAKHFYVEVFGQIEPVETQNGYLHMLIEDRVLSLGGIEARKRIRHLKLSGLKTEPAFAKYFGIPGDPYEALRQMALNGIPDDLTRRFTKSSN